MLDVYRQLLAILTPRDRGRVAVLFGMFTITALIEVAGVASIMPFVAALTNPQVIESNALLHGLYHHFGFTSANQFLTFLGAGVFLVLMTALGVQALTSWAQIRFAQMRLHDFGCRLMARYLAQDYEWSFRQQSADLSTKILQEVHRVVFGALYPALHVVSRALVTGFLLLLLLVLDPTLALAIGATVIVAYGVMYGSIRVFMERIGRERYEANQQRLRILQEAFGGLKEIKLAGLERSYLSRYFKPSRHLATREFWGEVTEEMPIHLIQALAFGGILLIVMYLIFRYERLDQVFSVLAVYAFAGFRILPGLQRIYRESSKLRFNAAAVTALHDDFRTLHRQGLEGDIEQFEAMLPRSAERLSLASRLELDNVSYRYPGAPNEALAGLSMAIAARTTVGLVGSTGAGKSTTVDLILGLLTPTAGNLLVDGSPIGPHNRRAWQNGIGYVPQSIYITSDTLRANIAFGVPPEQVDMDAVRRAASIAKLHDFVINELEAGYDTQLGERGVRLSGGQIQRVGIARALYHDPDVLVLDEATSALDNLTEQAVMDAVHALAHRKTIIMIAHRLTTVRACDQVFFLEDGRLAAAGTYTELLETSPGFRRMAEIA